MFCSKNLLQKIVFWSVLPLVFCACARNDTETEPFDFDFETEADLNALTWECRQLYSLSPEHVTHGKFSLKAELYPGLYPGLKIRRFDPDWSRYSALHFDLFNPLPDSLPLHIRIDDQQEHPEFENRFNLTIMLQPGAGHYILPLSKVITSGSKRPLKLSSIEAVYLFIVQPKKEVDLYFDFLHLE